MTKFNPYLFLNVIDDWNLGKITFNDLKTFLNKNNIVFDERVLKTFFAYY